MKILQKIYKKSLHNYWPLLLIILFNILFFGRYFFLNLVPLPLDFVVGVYKPWLNYKWDTVAGVAVKNPIMADVVSFSYPMREESVKQLKMFHAPLWNKYILTGTPLLANFQSAPFSPTNVFYFVFNMLDAWSLQVFSQHLLAAIFFYLFLRNYKLSKLSSMMASVFFAYSGFNVIWSQWNAHSLVAAFMPLIILFLEKYFKTNNKKWLVFFTASISLQIFSGYPQLVIYTLGLIYLYLFVNKFKKFFVVNLFIIIALLLASIQLFPSYELLQLSQRSSEAHPFEWAFLPFVKSITFIIPDYFGNHTTGNYFGPQDYTSNTGFIGVTAGVFVIATFFNIKDFLKKKAYIFGLLCLTSGLILSFPTPVSILIWKSGFLGLQAAAAHRSLIIFLFGVSIIFGISLDYLFQKKYKKNLVFSLIVFNLIMFLLISFAFVKYQYFDQLKYLVSIKNMVFPILILFLNVFVVFFVKDVKLKKIIILLLVLWELTRFFWKYTPFTNKSYLYPDTPVISFLKNDKENYRTTGNAVIPVNFRMPYKIDTLEGYDAVFTKNSADYVSISNDLNTDFNARRYALVDNIYSPYLDYANVKYIFLNKNDWYDNKQNYFNYEKVFEDEDVFLIKNNNYKKRAEIYFSYEVEKNNQNALKKVNDLYSQKVVLESDLERSFNSGIWEISEVSYLDNKVYIKYTSSEDGILVLSDQFYPGWHAYIKGREVPIYRANDLFRAVVVPKGENLVVFVYSPFSYNLGCFVSLLTLIFLISILYLSYYKKI